MKYSLDVSQALHSAKNSFLLSRVLSLPPQVSHFRHSLTPNRPEDLVIPSLLAMRVSRSYDFYQAVSLYFPDGRWTDRRWRC